MEGVQQVTHPLSCLFWPSFHSVNIGTTGYEILCSDQCCSDVNCGISGVDTVLMLHYSVVIVGISGISIYIIGRTDSTNQKLWAQPPTIVRASSSTPVLYLVEKAEKDLHSPIDDTVLFLESPIYICMVIPLICS